MLALAVTLADAVTVAVTVGAAVTVGWAVAIAVAEVAGAAESKPRINAYQKPMHAKANTTPANSKPRTQRARCASVCDTNVWPLGKGLPWRLELSLGSHGNA